MEKIKQHYTAEELNKMFGFTAESLEEECAMYENDAWEIGPGDVIYDILPDGTKRERNKKASFVISDSEMRKVKDAAEEQEITFSKFCRKAVKEAVEKWQAEKKHNLSKVAV